MIIGISIDGVLRDLFGQIEETYAKYFPEEPSVKILDYNFGEYITIPKEESTCSEITFNPDFNGEDMDISETTVTEEVTWREFLYEKCTLEIFGSAEEATPNVMNKLNNLILNTEHDIVLISREIGLSIPSTYFFLSKTSCMVKKIIFVSTYEDHWDYVDVMVTDNPEILESKPKDKLSIKFHKNFNVENNANYVIMDFNELFEHELLINNSKVLNI